MLTVSVIDDVRDIPDTMRAAVLRDYDKGLQVETIRMPRPKSGEVLIKVTACGLCHSDLHVIGGAIAFEALGIPSTWNTALDVLADGGCMVPIGLGAGRQNTEVEINRTVRRSQSILGSYGARTRQDLPAVVDLAARGVINDKDLVTRRFSLEEAGEGYEALRQHAVQGRAVVDMSL